MRLPLIPHPTSRHDGLTLEVEARRQGGRLSLDYALSGPVEAVLWPQQAARVRADDLWRATCFEAFAATPDGYVEYNLSPSGAWALRMRRTSQKTAASTTGTAAPLASPGSTARRWASFSALKT